MSVGVHLEISCQYSAHFLRLKPFSTASKSFGLAVLEADFSRSEFWLETKILLYKLTPGNTKMASEFEGVVKVRKISALGTQTANMEISLDCNS